MTFIIHLNNQCNSFIFLLGGNLNSETGYVRFEKIDKSYDGDVLVVKNLNLNIHKGEFVTMLGPSGSGKTTTLMMLAGFETPTNGEIFLQDKPISKIPPYEREIGMVFQNYALFPHMTVQENLAFPLEVRKMSKNDVEDKVKKGLAMVELEEFGSRFPAQLSGGQQQRVALARALVFEPNVVLMDEPLGALDKNLREQMQYEIKHIHERIGITVVYVTHDQSEALTMSNRIAVFNDGVVQQLSTPDVLYEKPENSFVAKFIGENNTMIGTVKEINGDFCTVELLNGKIVKALKVNVDSVGDKTELSVRPERVSIDNSNQTQNNFEGKVQELIYLGDHIRARLEVNNSDDFIVKIPNEGSIDLSVGKSINLSWNAEDVRALDYVK